MNKEWYKVKRIVSVQVLEFGVFLTEKAIFYRRPLKGQEINFSEGYTESLFYYLVKENRQEVRKINLFQIVTNNTNNVG